jgi:hypothetical protein
MRGGLESDVSDNGSELREIIVNVYGGAPTGGTPADRYLRFADTMVAGDRIALVACEL